MYYISIKTVEQAVKLLASHTGKIYTIKSANHRIEVCDSDGVYIGGNKSGAQLAHKLKLMAYEQMVLKLVAEH